MYVCHIATYTYVLIVIIIHIHKEHPEHSSHKWLSSYMNSCMVAIAKCNIASSHVTYVAKTYGYDRSNYYS